MKQAIKSFLSTTLIWTPILAVISLSFQRLVDKKPFGQDTLQRIKSTLWIDVLLASLDGTFDAVNTYRHAQEANHHNQNLVETIRDLRAENAELKAQVAPPVMQESPAPSSDFVRRVATAPISYAEQVTAEKSANSSPNIA